MNVGIMVAIFAVITSLLAFNAGLQLAKERKQHEKLLKEIKEAGNE